MECYEALKFYDVALCMERAGEEYRNPSMGKQLSLLVGPELFERPSYQEMAWQAATNVQLKFGMPELTLDILCKKVRESYASDGRSDEVTFFIDNLVQETKKRVFEENQ